MNSTARRLIQAKGGVHTCQTYWHTAQNLPSRPPRHRSISVPTNKTHKLFHRGSTQGSANTQQMQRSHMQQRPPMQAAGAGTTSASSSEEVGVCAETGVWAESFSICPGPAGACANAAPKFSGCRTFCFHAPGQEKYGIPANTSAGAASPTFRSRPPRRTLRQSRHPQ